MALASDRLKGYVVAALAILLTLGLAEVILRVSEYADPASRKDPFFEFAGTNPAFEVREIHGEGRFYVPTPNKRSIEAKFPAIKTPDTYRIFAFGGSTTRGSPYGNRASFSFWLRSYLSGLYPDKNIEVVNCGHSGFGSSPVLQIVEEAKGYDLDLFVLYTGQNEFRDAVFHARELNRSRFTSDLMRTTLESRVAYLMFEGFLVLKSALIGTRQTSWGGALISNVVSNPYRDGTFNSFDYYSIPELQPRTQSNPEEKLFEDEADKISELRKKVKLLIGAASRPLNRLQVLEDFRRNIFRMSDAATGLNIPIIFVKKARNPKARNVRASKRILIDRRLSLEEVAQLENHYRDGLNYLQQEMFA